VVAQGAPEETEREASASTLLWLLATVGSRLPPRPQRALHLSGWVVCAFTPRLVYWSQTSVCLIFCINPSLLFAAPACRLRPFNRAAALLLCLLVRASSRALCCCRSRRAYHYLHFALWPPTFQCCAWHSFPQYTTALHREHGLRAPPATPATPQLAQVRDEDDGEGRGAS
jgi:hypothetical protein